MCISWKQQVPWNCKGNFLYFLEPESLQLQDLHCSVTEQIASLLNKASYLNSHYERKGKDFFNVLGKGDWKGEFWALLNIVP
jgi:ribosomal protein S15P/S13E